MAIILGIDPGSQITGFGVIASDGNKYSYITSGVLSVAKNSFPNRLREIFIGINKIIVDYKPDQAAIEQIFVHVNASSALKLGHARGAAITAVMMNDLSLAEYSARQVKLSVVGYGAASKDQVQHMVKVLLRLSGKMKADAADALGIALCHANNMKKGLL